MNAIELDSNSIGDPALSLTLSDLEPGLANLPVPSKEAGKAVFLVRRLDGGRRELLDEIQLSPEQGVPGGKKNAAGHGTPMNSPFRIS